MSKEQLEVDTGNPFIPSLSPACRLADKALLFCVALFGLAAAGAALIAEVL